MQREPSLSASTAVKMPGDMAVADPGQYIDAYIRALRAGDPVAARTALRAFRHSEHGEQLLQEGRDLARDARTGQAERAARPDRDDRDGPGFIATGLAAGAAVAVASDWDREQPAVAVPPQSAIPAWTETATPAQVAQLANEHPLFAQALQQLQQLGPQAGGYRNGQELELVAGGLALEASRQQLRGIDGVMPNQDGSRLVATWQNPNNSADVRHAAVDPLQFTQQANLALQQQTMLAELQRMQQEQIEQRYRDEQRREEARRDDQRDRDVAARGPVWVP